MGAVGGLVLVALNVDPKPPTPSSRGKGGDGLLLSLAGASKHERPF